MEDLAPNEERTAFATAARRAMETCPRADGAAAARHLAETGLLGMLAHEEVGGLGLGLADALPVAEAAGATLLPFPLVEILLAAAELHRILPDAALALVGGEAVASIGWRGRLSAEDTASGWRVTGSLGRVPMAEQARWLIAPVCLPGQETVAGIAVVDLLQARPEAVPDEGLDLERPAATLSFGAPVAAEIHLDNGGAWGRIAAHGALLRAADMLGSAEASFTAASEHVSTRRQFGRLLVANQVLRHMLARDHLALVGARHSLAHAAMQTDAAAPDAETARLVACAVAAEACVHAAENAIQLHGGMGFTWDLPLHRRLRRIRAATALFDAVAARAALAEQVLGQA